MNYIARLQAELAAAQAEAAAKTGIARELRGHPETNESDSMRLSRSRISVA